MKGGKLYLWGVGLAFVLVMILNVSTPEKINWQESFSRYKSTPYGAEVIYELLPGIFSDSLIGTSHRSLYEMRYDPQLSENIVLIDNNLNLDENDAESLMGMVAEGHTAFIASRYFYGTLADSLNLSADNHYQFIPPDSIVTHNLIFENAPLAELDSLPLTRSQINQYFSSYDTLNTEVLARNARGEPVFLRTEFGEGNFYFCSTPLAFTNYHMLNGEEAFAEAALSHLPVANVLWDEYYKWGRIGNRSPLRFILSQTALKWALYITLAMALLFILVNLKREQRAIPVVEPLKNATKEFMHTVGRLYMQKGDHADIAQKMARYLKDEIRQNCYATHVHGDEDLIDRMSERYGIPLERVTALFARMRYVEEAKVISQEELLEFSAIVEKNKSILRNGER